MARDERLNYELIPGDLVKDEVPWLRMRDELKMHELLALAQIELKQMHKMAEAQMLISEAHKVAIEEKMEFYGGLQQTAK